MGLNAAWGQPRVRGMTEPTQSTTEPTASAELLAAEARRRRGFKRLVAAFAGGVLFLAGVRLWWGWEASRRLQAEIDRIRAAGEPILVEDFQSETTIPDEENAAVLYRRAYAALVRPTGLAITLDDVMSDSRVASAYPEDTRAIIGANSEVLSLLRRARQMERADWGIRFTSPMINMRLPHLSEQRRLSQLARSAAIVQQQQGDHAEAFETLADIQPIGNRLASRASSVVITHLVVIVINALQAYTVEDMASALVIDATGPDSSRSVRSVARMQVENIIRSLLDEQNLRTSWRWALLGARAERLDTATVLADGGVGLFPAGVSTGSSVLGILMRPLFQLEAVCMMQHVTRAGTAGLAATWPESKLLAPSLPNGDELLGIHGAVHLLSHSLAPSYNRARHLHFRTFALRRMAATALAIRLYELDHGQRPESLEQLIPDYLDALPHDPFATDGRTFGYKPNAEPPILYSVAHDAQDDDGDFALKRDGSIDEDLKDLPFFLNGDRPRPPLKLLRARNSSLQAVKDDGQEDEGKRNADDRDIDGDEVEDP